MMTPDGYWYDVLGASVFYGDTLIEKTEEDQCTRWILLQVRQDSVIVNTDVDTTLCLGNTFVLGYTTYTADTMFYGTVQIDEDTWLKGNIAVHFTEPEMEYDTIQVTSADSLPYIDTLIVITKENECTRWIMRHVEVTEGIDNTVAPAAGVYKYLLDGNLYIRREEQDYDLLGRPIYKQQ